MCVAVYFNLSYKRLKCNLVPIGLRDLGNKKINEISHTPFSTINVRYVVNIEIDHHVLGVINLVPFCNARLRNEG